MAKHKKTKKVSPRMRREIYSMARDIHRGEFVKTAMLAVLFVVSMVFFFAYANQSSDIIKASPADVESGINTGKNYVSAVVDPLLAPLFGDQEVLTRILFAVLLYMIISSIVGVIFAGKKWTNLIASLIITALAILFIPANFLTAIRDHYGVMGAAILSIIPFMIMVVFTVRARSRLVGQLLWVFYALYYFAIYLYRIFSNNSGWLSADSIPYAAALLAGAFMFFGLGVVRKLIFKGEIDAMKEEGVMIAEQGKLLKQLQKKDLEQYKRQNWDR